MSASGGAGASAGPRELGRPSPDNGYARALALNKHARENPAPVVEEPPKSPRTAALERARALPDGDRRELRPTALLRRALLAMADNDVRGARLAGNINAIPPGDPTGRLAGWDRDGDEMTVAAAAAMPALAAVLTRAGRTC